jgi:GTP-binding protein Era
MPVRTVTPSFRCGYACIVGRPNVGKSTLLNNLIGQKISITSAKPQTTRWRLLGIKTTPHWQIIFIDTPGLQNRRQSSLHRHMQGEIVESLYNVNVVIFVIEAMKWTKTEERILRLIEKVTCPVLLLINKVDRIKNKKELLPFIAKLAGMFEFKAIMPVTATSTDDVNTVEKRIAPLLPEARAEYPADQISDKNERFFAAEFIREQLTRILRSELPYKISVTIDDYTEKRKVLYIRGCVWVETKSQSKIVVGKNGRVLKLVGERARRDMETLFGKKVFLELWVKVLKEWTETAQALKQLGYQSLP